MTKQELSCLLYLETRAVDHAGRVNVVHLNDDDRATIKIWTESGFIEYGRVCFADIGYQSQRHASTTWVKLSDEAFRLAHAERKARAERQWLKRTYRTTKEETA